MKINWKFWTVPLLKYLQSRFLKLSMADGRPGLSTDDFKVLVGKIVAVSTSYKNASGLTKAKAVGAWLLDEFAGEINEYVVPILVSKAYEYADTKGLLPPK